jgi:hypothetical protein
MPNPFKQLITFLWKFVPWRGREARAYLKPLEIGVRVFDEEPTRRRISLDTTQRTMHVAVVGKSGTGKSSLLKHMSQQDIDAGRGFVYFDLHGDATPFLLRSIAAREQKLRRHLSDRLVVIAPGDPELSVGLNPLEQESPDFVRIAEFAEVLKRRWHLDHFGARTDELLRFEDYLAEKHGRHEIAELLKRHDATA